MLAATNGSPVEAHAAHSLAVWNRIVGDTFGSTQVISSAPSFDGSLASRTVDDLQIIHIEAQQSLVQKRAQARRAGGAGQMLVHLQVRGTSLNTQDSRSGLLAAGEAVLCDPARDYSVEFASGYEMFVLNVPTARLASCCPGIDPGSDTAIRLDSSRSSLLLAFLSAAWTQWSCLREDAEWRECVNQTVLDLLVRAIKRCDERRSEHSCKALQSAVLRYVRTNLRNPELRTSLIARSVGVSARSVQTVFEDMATTASEYILTQRLRAAATLLRNRRLAVTQIAMDLGFNDASYFSKCFHRHYGSSPRDFARRC